jgi:16S rRNA A1518/A1519 N6-dimethyltransferase RsmA/KsgA/DIM1 with predicted DNA glycosylase/AP lyase activity
MVYTHLVKIGGYEIQVPFVTTSTDHIKSILELAAIKKGTSIVDLGSGDGRMVLEFAKAGGYVAGYEIKPDLVARSKKRISEAGLENNAVIYQRDFWTQNLSSFETVYIYGMGSIMGRLEQKLEKELQPGSTFVSNIFRLPHWKIKRTKNGVHLYVVPSLK